MLEIKVKRSLPGFTLNVELEIDREIISILGPSGSGKTMTLLCIAGLVRPDSGFIKLNNRALFNSEDNTFLPPRKRKIGFVFQNYSLFPHMTVAENIAFGLRGQPVNYVSHKVQELLEVMHIPILKERYPSEISSGQQQRVALARAIAPEPKALLLDEPFSALDTYRRERLEYELLSLQNYYKGDILFVTHDLDQGYKVGTRMAIFDSGRIVQCAENHQVISFPANHTAARLTGYKNLIRGRISSVKSDYTEVFVPEFSESLKVNHHSTFRYQVNQAVIIGIRPEHLTALNQPKDNSIPCRLDNLVDSVSYLYAYYYAEKDRKKRYSLETRISGQLPASPHQSSRCCFIYFDPQKMIILPDPGSLTG